MQRFADDPDHPGRRIWKRSGSGAGAIASAIVMLLCVVGAAMLAYVAATLVPPTDAIPLGLGALFMLALAAYVRRDRRGKASGTILLDDDGLTLDLPCDRSLAHHSPAFRGTIHREAIASVAHRLEGYGAQGLAMVQRSYWLVLRSGPPLLLFEDRGIGSAQATDPMMMLAEEIAQRCGLPLIERPMARGRGGILGAWFARGPALDAAPMSERAQRWMWRRVWITGSLASLALLALTLGMMIGG